MEVYLKKGNLQHLFIKVKDFIFSRDIDKDNVIILSLDRSGVIFPGCTKKYKVTNNPEKDGFITVEEVE